MSSVKSASRRFHLPRFLRRSSNSNASSGSDSLPPRTPSSLRKSISLSKLAGHTASEVRDKDEQYPGREGVESRLVQSEVLQKPDVCAEHSQHSQHSQLSQHSHKTTGTATTSAQSTSPSYTRASTTTSADLDDDARQLHSTTCPQVTLEEPTPIHPPAEPAPTTPSPANSLSAAGASTSPATSANLTSSSAAASAAASASSHPHPHPQAPSPVRRQSLVANTDARVIKTLLAPDAPSQPVQPSPPTPSDYFGAVQPAITAAMLHRKIWVKRPNASATLVQIGEDDLVDDVRDMILRKYANSLGRSFDAPDVTLRIAPRDAAQGQERLLGPEEDMCRTLDAYFPGGQTVHEALIIDVPTRRTPKPSPRVPLYYAHHDDAQHAQTEYFPPMPVAHPSPAAAQHGPPHPAPHSIAILTNGGQLPPLPSPGGAATRRLHHNQRPRNPRHNTASPTTLAGGIPSSATAARPNRPRHDSSASTDKHSQASNAPIPTPPAPVDPPVRSQHDVPPTVRVASPRPEKKKKKKAAPAESPSLPAGLLDGSVPPINVLIVEDNIINLRVLGAFMQRLKVRWQRAMNGKEAVTKWKAGGFHLVLMDIQLPVMNGLEATKEIRRLERVNSIGVFSSGSNEAPNTRLGQQNGSDPELVADDKLGDRNLFKSPVIIVALTASSLQSDRHEALAAGCNDFLTKPVNFVWLERKVKEWGCMQALIDFDGWRKWKDFAKDSDSAKDKDANKMSTSMASIAPANKSSTAKPTAPQLAANTSDTNGAAPGSSSQDKEDKKAKRKSIVQAPTTVPEDESETPTPDAESA